MRILFTVISLFFIITQTKAQPLQPLKPTIITGSIKVGYSRHKNIKKNLFYSLNSDIDFDFSLFPISKGIAPGIENSADLRYYFSRKKGLGFGPSIFLSNDLTLNTIYYKDKKYDNDWLIAFNPGLKILGRIKIRDVIHIEPYLCGSFNFFISLKYYSGWIPYNSVEGGIKLTFSKLAQIQ